MYFYIHCKLCFKLKCICLRSKLCICAVIQATKIQNRIRVIVLVHIMFYFISVHICSAVFEIRAEGKPHKKVKVCI